MVRQRLSFGYHLVYHKPLCLRSYSSQNKVLILLCQLVRDPAKNVLSTGSVSTILPRTISRVPLSIFGILPAQNIGIPWKFLSNVSFSLKESTPVLVNIIKMFLFHSFALPFHHKYTYLMVIEKIFI